MTKAVLINGNSTKNSRLTGVHHFIEEYLKNFQVDVESIYVHELPAQDLIFANFLSEEIKRANKQVEEAEIVIILTPIFKASYTGILKAYLDLLPQKALEGKKIVPVAIGGSIAHLLALEYALKPVLSVLGATEILNSIFIVDKQIERLDNGRYQIEEEALNRLKTELLNLLSIKVYV